MTAETGDPNAQRGGDLRPDSLVYEVFVLGQAVKRLLDAAMADGPLRPEEYAVYSVVFEAESVTPTAMAAALAMPLTTVMDWVQSHGKKVTSSGLYVLSSLSGSSQGSS